MRAPTGEGCWKEEDGQMKVPSVLISLFLIVDVTCQNELRLLSGLFGWRAQLYLGVFLDASLSRQGFSVDVYRAACHI